MQCWKVDGTSLLGAAGNLSRRKVIGRVISWTVKNIRKEEKEFRKKGIVWISLCFKTNSSDFYDEEVFSFCVYVSEVSEWQSEQK